jgi:hypothetical protein
MLNIAEFKEYCSVISEGACPFSTVSSNSKSFQYVSKMAIENWERCKSEQKHNKTDNSLKMAKNHKLDIKNS